MKRPVLGLVFCLFSTLVQATLPDPSVQASAEPKPSGDVNQIPRRSLSSILGLEATEHTISGRYGKPGGIFGQSFTIGPKISALGLPSPIRFGIESKWNNTWGLGLDLGIIPTTTLNFAQVKLTTWTGALRFYPWKGAFYLGVGAGKQSLQVSRTEVFGDSTYTAQINFDSITITPQLGWRWVWESGFYMGMEVGLQVPVSPKQTITTDAATIITTSEEYQTLINDVANETKVLTRNPFPHFAMLQVGYFF